MADILVHSDDGKVEPALKSTALPPIGFRRTETPATIEFTADVAGFDEEEIEVLLTGDHLTVVGHHSKSAEIDLDGDDDSTLESDTLGPAHAFSQSLPVPSGISASRIEAELDDGVLTIFIEKPSTDTDPGAPEAA